jgi:hypothetical protein
MANLDSKLIKISRIHFLAGAGFVDEIMAGSFTVRQSKTILARSCEAESVSVVRRR